MWVPVAVWQPCELLYTCYLLTYLLTYLYAASLSRLVSVYESSFWTSEEIHETSYNRSDAIWQASVRAENISRRTDNIDQQRGRQISREVRAILAPLEGARSEHVRCWYGVFGRSGSHTFKTCSQRINRTELANCSQSTSWRRHVWPITRPVIGSTWCRYVHYCSVQFCPLWTPFRNHLLLRLQWGCMAE